MANGVKHKGWVSIVGEYSDAKPSFKFIFEKKSKITKFDTDLVSEVYKLANSASNINEMRRNSYRARSSNMKSTQTATQNFSSFGSNKERKSISTKEQEVFAKLEEMGVQVFHQFQKGRFAEMTWDQLAGYEDQKRDIKESILMALEFPGIPP